MSLLHKAFSLNGQKANHVYSGMLFVKWPNVCRRVRTNVTSGKIQYFIFNIWRRSYFPTRCGRLLKWKKIHLKHLVSNVDCKFCWITAHHFKSFHFLTTFFQLISWRENALNLCKHWYIFLYPTSNVLQTVLASFETPFSCVSLSTWIASMANAFSRV